MNGLLQKLLSRRQRRIPAALCMLALAMQVMLPVLHGGHGGAGLGHLTGSSSPALQAPADHGTAQSGHDAAHCPQCRLVSQLRTLTPFSMLATLPELRAAWIAGPAHVDAASQATCDSGAPRAPPTFPA